MENDIYDATIEATYSPRAEGGEAVSDSALGRRVSGASTLVLSLTILLIATSRLRFVVRPSRPGREHRRARRRCRSVTGRGAQGARGALER
jgi:hypothetical protein